LSRKAINGTKKLPYPAGLGNGGVVAIARRFECPT
jgi:hypothetical protein